MIAKEKDFILCMQDNQESGWGRYSFEYYPDGSLELTIQDGLNCTVYEIHDWSDLKEAFLDFVKENWLEVKED